MGSPAETPPPPLPLPSSSSSSSSSSLAPPAGSPSSDHHAAAAAAAIPINASPSLTPRGEKRRHHHKQHNQEHSSSSGGGPSGRRGAAVSSDLTLLSPSAATPHFRHASASLAGVNGDAAAAAATVVGVAVPGLSSLPAAAGLVGGPLDAASPAKRMQVQSAALGSPRLMASPPPPTFATLPPQRGENMHMYTQLVSCAHVASAAGNPAQHCC